MEATPTVIKLSYQHNAHLWDFVCRHTHADTVACLAYLGLGAVKSRGGSHCVFAKCPTWKESENRYSHHTVDSK